MEEFIFSFMFVGGCLLFLFGAMILGHTIMYIRSIIFLMVVIFIATYNFKPQTQGQKN